MKLRYLAPLSLLTLAFACSSNESDSENDQGNGTGGAGGAPAQGDGDGDGDSSTGGSTDMGGATATGGSASTGGSPNTNDDPIVSNPQDSECDLSGVWAIQAKTATSADAPIGGTQHQVANRWYLYEISQEGSDVEVLRSLNCGLQVKNKAGSFDLHITISEEGLKSILAHNSHAGLTGTYTKSGESCELDLERQYVVLGGNTQKLLPADPASRPGLDELTALPTPDAEENAEDWDGDGDLGLRFDIDALISGTRNSVQRSFIEFDSDADAYSIALNASEFTVNNQVQIEESVMTFTNNLVRTPGSLEGSDHPVTFTRLGDTRETAKLPSGDSIPSDDLAACQALEAEFPYAQ